MAVQDQPTEDQPEAAPTVSRLAEAMSDLGVLRLLGGLLYRSSSAFYNEPLESGDPDVDVEMLARQIQRRRARDKLIGMVHEAMRAQFAADPDAGFSMLLDTVYGDDEDEANFMLHGAIDGLVTRPDGAGNRTGGLENYQVDLLIRVLHDLDSGARSDDTVGSSDAALGAHSELAGHGFLTATQIQWLKQREH